MRLPDLSLLRSYDDIKAFFKDNKQALDYLDEYQGLDNFLGSGEYGKVWKIKDKELTLKITKDPLEIEVSEKLAGKNTKGFIKIYSTVRVANLLLKVQEMCYPTQNASIGSFVYDYYIQSKNKSVDDFKEWAMKYYSETVVDKIPSDTRIQKFLKLAENLVEDCEKYLNGSDSYEELDTHPGNIMQTKTGELRLVDF